MTSPATKPNEPIESTPSIHSDTSMIHEFDLTPQIDHLFDISTPNLTINSTLNLADELEVALPDFSNVHNCTKSINEEPVLINTSLTNEQNNDFKKGELQTFCNLKLKNLKNPCISYLNINSLRGNKFTQLKEMLSFVKPEILCIDETKLTPDFPTAQFQIDGYHYPPFRRDRPQRINSTHFGGGKIVYVKEDLISDRLEKYETTHAETICLDLTIQERKWFILFAYRPESIDRKLFFDELNKTLSKASKRIMNILLLLLNREALLMSF